MDNNNKLNYQRVIIYTLKFTVQRYKFIDLSKVYSLVIEVGYRFGIEELKNSVSSRYFWRL